MNINTEHVKSYFELHIEQRWLGSSSPYAINGQSVEIAKISNNLDDLTKRAFAINCVPEDV